MQVVREQDLRIMFGKHFESMYTGSMVGSGAVAFAVMGYIISHQKPPSFDVELNPTILSTIIGESEEEIVKAIQRFCEPDLKSRTKAEDGRKLLKLGEYLYHVVNGKQYHAMRTNEERREYFRVYRQQKRNGAAPPPATKVKESKPDVEIPPELQTPDFLKAWGEWKTHLKEKKTKTTPSAFRAQLETCKQLGEVEAIASINRSITGSYQSIFIPKSYGTKPTGHVSAC